MRRAAILGICGWAVLVTGGCKFWSKSGDTARTEAVMIDPPSPRAGVRGRLDDAEAARASGDYETALAMFRDILAQNPTVTHAYVGIGEIYLEKQDYLSAEPYFARAVRYEPRNFGAQFGHGVVLQMLNRLVDAIKAYHRALTIEPDHPRANLNMATTYMQLGEPANALAFAEKAVKIDPASGPARVNLGAVYEQLGRSADAIEQYDAAVELMEPDGPLLMNLFNALSQEQRFEEARNTALAMIRIHPTAASYERLGWVQFRLKDYQKSVEAYRKAVEIDPNHWPSLNGVGVNALNVWLLSRKADEAAASEARQAFRRSLRINSDQPKIIRLLSDYNL
jgi:tetratricopeptide (TPR) repeat protein